MKLLSIIVLFSSLAFAGDKHKEPKSLSADTKLAIRELQLQQREIDVKAMQALSPFQKQSAVVQELLTEELKRAFAEAGADTKDYDLDPATLMFTLKPPPPLPMPSLRDQMLGKPCAYKNEDANGLICDGKNWVPKAEEKK